MSDAPVDELELERLRAENAALRAGQGDAITTVSLGGQAVALVRPTALDERWNLAINMARAGREQVVMWAALGLCWPAFRQREPYLGDLLTYGRKVFNTLAGEGVPPRDVISAAWSAYQLATNHLVSVENVADFSSTPRDGSEPAGSSPESSS